MLKAGVGVSQNKNAFKAGEQACQEAVQSVGSKADLVVVFSTVALNQQEMLDGVNFFAKGTPVVGCSSAGEITNRGPSSQSVVAMALASDQISWNFGVGLNTSKDSFAAGQQVAEQIKKKAVSPVSLLMMFLDGLAENGAAAVRGAQSVLGVHLPIMGGSAGDDFQFKKTFQYFKNKVLTDSMLGIGLSGKFSVGVGVMHGWEPVGLPMKVTKSKGSKLIEVNGRPALSIYEDYFGKKAEELTKEPIAKMAYTYPLGLSIEGSPELLIVDVIIANEKGEITCAAEIPQGSYLRLMLGDADKAITAATIAAKNALKQLSNRKPQAVFVFDCMARKKLLGERVGDEIAAIQDVLGKRTPMIGLYTYGEQAPLAGLLGSQCCSMFHNETMTLFALGG